MGDTRTTKINLGILTVSNIIRKVMITLGKISKTQTGSKIISLTITRDIIKTRITSMANNNPMRMIITEIKDQAINSNHISTKTISITTTRITEIIILKEATIISAALKIVPSPIKVKTLDLIVKAKLIPIMIINAMWAIAISKTGEKEMSLIKKQTTSAPKITTIIARAILSPSIPEVIMISNRINLTRTISPSTFNQVFK